MVSTVCRTRCGLSQECERRRSLAKANARTLLACRSRGTATQFDPRVSVAKVLKAN